VRSWHKRRPRDRYVPWADLCRPRHRPAAAPIRSAHFARTWARRRRRSTQVRHRGARSIRTPR
jgi:hypothetical protein